MVFNQYTFSNVYVYGSVFYNIHTLTFWNNQYCVLYLDSSTVSYLGLHLLFEVTETRNISLSAFLEVDKKNENDFM